MDYADAQVTLLYQVGSGGGATWSTLASTTTNNNAKGNNYAMSVEVPPGSSYTCKVEVAIPLNFGDEAGGYANNIDAQGFSPVFTLSSGGAEVVGAALNSMNVNTLTDDPNGVQFQNTITLRDAIETGNNGPPFPAVTFNGTPSGTISLAAQLPAIQKSYNINGPGPNTLSVNGNSTGTVFTVNEGVTSTISGLLIEGGSGTNGGGVLNNGNLTLNNVSIGKAAYPNQVTGVGGGIDNDSGAELRHCARISCPFGDVIFGDESHSSIPHEIGAS